MHKKERHRHRNRRPDHLISVYLKLKRDEQEEHEKDRLDVWVRAFLRFGAVIYFFFLIDVLLPATEWNDVITRMSTSRTISGDGKDTGDGFNHIMQGLTLHTNHGHITALAVTGQEEVGQQVVVGRSLLFKCVRYLYVGDFPKPIIPAINLFGWAVFLPLMALLTCVWGGFISRSISHTLFTGALNVLFFLPFMLILFVL